MMPGGHGILVGSIAAMTLLLVSCEPTATTPVSSSTSNPVVVYASYEDESYLPDFFNAFTESTGIRVVVRHTNSAVDEVIADHGSPPADVLLTREAVGVWRAADEGALRPLGPGDREKRSPEWSRDPDGYWAAISLRPSLLVYDSRVADLEVPASYEELADERFRGQLCLSSSSATTNRTVIAMLINEMGERPAEIVVRGWLRNLAMSVFSTDDELLQAIESAQCTMGIVASDSYSALARDSDYVRSADFVQLYANIEGVGIARHSRNPEAALELIDWMLSDVAQARHSAGRLTVSVTDSAGQQSISRENISAVAAHNEGASKLAERAGYH
jgi:iron(III) transport system substrate-binding protein